MFIYHAAQIKYAYFHRLCALITKVFHFFNFLEMYVSFYHYVIYLEVNSGVWLVAQGIAVLFYVCGTL